MENATVTLMVEISIQCPLCGNTYTVRVYKDDYDKFCLPRGERPLIQHIFPYLSNSERELLISGVCDDCYKNMFSDEDDDYEGDEDISEEDYYNE